MVTAKQKEDEYQRWLQAQFNDLRVFTERDMELLRLAYNAGGTKHPDLKANPPELAVGDTVRLAELGPDYRYRPKGEYVVTAPIKFRSPFKKWRIKPVDSNRGSWGYDACDWELILVRRGPNHV